jgi:hypothetical protein
VTRARRGALLALAALVPLAVVATAQEDPGGRSAYVVEASGASLDDLLGVPALRGIAAFGGAGLLVETGSGSTAGAAAPGSTVVAAGSLSSPDGSADRARIEAVAVELRTWLVDSRADRVLVLVAVASPPPDDIARGDTVGAVVAAIGRPSAIADAMERGDASPFALTSDSTRRDGVVASSDVPATVVAFVGTGDASGDDLGGAPIRSTASGPPFELHERYLGQRRLYVPIGTAATLYVTIGGLFAVAALAFGDRVPRGLRRALGWLSLSVPALGAALLAAGHLPELTYAAAVPFVAIVTVFGTLSVSPLERRDVTLVPMALGALVLAAFAVEAATGWEAMLTPLVGGSQLDGGRFYGMPNVAIGLVIGASVYLAHRLPTTHGVAVIVAAALLASMPFAGANLGAGVSLFATAGLWLAVRERARLRPVGGVAVVAGVTVLGTAVILVAHALSPVATHVTRFERTAGGLGGVLDTIGDRLRVGVDLLARNPAALAPVIGLLAVLLVIARPPAPVRRTFDRWPAWRDAVLVCALGGVAAYLANDTGAAAAGFAFGLALGGIVGVSLLAVPGKMGRDGA